MKCTALSLHTALLQQKQRSACVGGGKKHSVYCNAVCLFSSRFPGWLLTWSYSISYYWLTVWRTSTLVSWKPNKSNKMCHGTHYDMKNELLTPKCHLSLTFAAQSHVMKGKVIFSGIKVDVPVSRWMSVLTMSRQICNSLSIYQALHF